MKKYTSLRKGFTLVELMIVIAIIGILAAVLYPGFNGFMEGARDSARQTTLKNYSTALLAYNQDNSEFPKTKAAANTGNAETMCINDLFENHLKKHMSKGVEKDPKPGNGVDIGDVNCAGKTEGGYGYKPLKLGKETAANGNAYALAAKMEKWSNANFDGSTIGDLEERDKFTALTKGTDELKALKDDSSKTYYVVVN